MGDSQEGDSCQMPGDPSDWQAKQVDIKEQPEADQRNHPSNPPRKQYVGISDKDEPEEDPRLGEHGLEGSHQGALLREQQSYSMRFGMDNGLAQHGS